MTADPAVPPSGVVTFLFTDVVGSTRRWEADANKMRIALAAHDAVLHRAIEAHGAWLFKHTGDGVCAAFASPKSAVDAAVAAQRALELPVRMGTATGEAELRGADYFGVVLNRAARLMAAGHGGQILLADSTVSLLSGVDLLDLGPRRLRDLPTAVRVFQVRAPGLRMNFPALAACTERPLIFPLSNPTSRMEAIPADVLAWSGGKTLVATGSPAMPVQYEGTFGRIGQANNALVFPGIGLGAIVGGAQRVTKRMLDASAKAVAQQADAPQPGYALLPDIDDLSAVSAVVAEPVYHAAVEDSVATKTHGDVEQAIFGARWLPQYNEEIGMETDSGF